MKCLKTYLARQLKKPATKERADANNVFKSIEG